LWTITVFALFSIVLRWGHAVRSTTLAGLALYVAAAIGANYDFRSLPAFTAVFTAIAGGAVGAALRIHQRYWWSLEQRAKDAVATRESEGTRRVVEERLRIARDLHDVVGHEIAVVNMHLGVAEVNLPADAAQSRTSVEAARSAVRSVLTETQRILLVLRRESVEHDDAGQPTPQADRLPELIESYRSIGLRVTAELGELPAQLDPAVGVTAFRIMQEALTNAHRYGDGSVSVTVKVSDERVLIDVVNPRRQLGVEQSQGGGHGLLGVRERVASAGGMLTVSDDDPGEFGLHVALAIDGSDLYDRRLHRR
jgi:signal transduction histidine kinase